MDGLTIGIGVVIGLIIIGLIQDHWDHRRQV
jgi:hypothetical protein